MKVILELKKPATGSGGDRYEGFLPTEQKPWTVYIPQSITRGEGGAIAKKVQLTVQVSEND